MEGGEGGGEAGGPHYVLGWAPFLVNICIRVGLIMTCSCLFFCHDICNVTHNSLFRHVSMPNHPSQSTNDQT